jgi:hypothetical protein
MRTRTKNDAQKLTLTLSAPSREALMREAMRRGVSRTQVVEDLIDGFQWEKPLAESGKVKPQPHKGAFLRSARNGGIKNQKKSTSGKKAVQKAA